MHRFDYDLGILSGRFALVLSLPTFAGTVFAHTQTIEIIGTKVLPTTPFSITLLALSLLLFILTIHWRTASGDDWKDTLLAILASLPFIYLVALLDPTGRSPVPF